MGRSSHSCRFTQFTHRCKRNRRRSRSTQGRSPHLGLMRRRRRAAGGRPFKTTRPTRRWSNTRTRMSGGCSLVKLRSWQDSIDAKFKGDDWRTAAVPQLKKERAREPFGVEQLNPIPETPLRTTEQRKRMPNVPFISVERRLSWQNICQCGTKARVPHQNDNSRSLPTARQLDSPVRATDQGGRQAYRFPASMSLALMSAARLR